MIYRWGGDVLHIAAPNAGHLLDPDLHLMPIGKKIYFGKFTSLRMVQEICYRPALLSVERVVHYDCRFMSFH